MLLWSTRVSVAVFGVVLTLEVTEIVLAIDFFNLSHGGTGGGCTPAAGAASSPRPWRGTHPRQES